MASGAVIELRVLLLDPWTGYAFMRKALAACLALSLGSGSIGVFLVLRRMSLMGDAMSHAILPGAAIGFLVAGFSLWSMSLGGLVAGLAVAILAGLVARTTTLKEDASLAGFYLISLAVGVLVISKYGSNVDLLHILFGTILAVDTPSLIFVSLIATMTLLTLALIYRPLVVECFDPSFMATVDGRGSVFHVIFLILVVLNLIAGFEALGTLMAVGLMMLPAAAARLWAHEVWSLSLVATGLAFLSGIAGLLLSFHLNLPSGPAIILVAGISYVASIIIGRNGGLMKRYFPRPHFHGPRVRTMGKN
jgi:zinc/manganese transport system permease protein